MLSGWIISSLERAHHTARRVQVETLGKLVLCEPVLPTPAVTRSPVPSPDPQTQLDAPSCLAPLGPGACQNRPRLHLLVEAAQGQGPCSVHPHPRHPAQHLAISAERLNEDRPLGCIR